jgi:hypothetical protein
MFDNLYVLAKGGVCVYFGAPQDLSTHLTQCQIRCNENQVPIETLVRIASKGTADMSVIEMRNKTYSQIFNTIQCKINETKQIVIQTKSKSFYLKDIYLLIMRNITEFYSYKWRQSLLCFTAIVGIIVVMSLQFNANIGKYTDCMAMNVTLNESCIEHIDSDYMIFQKI